jgi:hypothetical protein
MVQKKEVKYNLEPDFIYRDRAFASYEDKYWMCNCIDSNKFVQISYTSYNVHKLLNKSITTFRFDVRTDLELVLGNRLMSGIVSYPIDANSISKDVLKRALDRAETINLKSDYYTEGVIEEEVRRIFVEYSFKDKTSLRLILGDIV